MHMWLSRNHLIIAPKWGVPNGNCMSDDTVEVIGLVPQCYEALSSTRKSLGTRLHTHTQTHAHTLHTCAHTHAYTHTHMHTHVHTCTHMHTHAHTCTHMHTLSVHTHYLHTHTHTQIHHAALATLSEASHLKATPTIRGAFLPGSLLKVVNTYIVPLCHV